MFISLLSFLLFFFRLYLWVTSSFPFIAKWWCKAVEDGAMEEKQEKMRREREEKSKE